MWSKLWFCAFLALASLLQTKNLHAQCFATSGNPVGGAANLGVMDKGTLRVMTYYRYHFGSRYYQGDQRYDGPSSPLSSANYNYQGLLLGYGLGEKLSVEAEGGYFYNKTQKYRLSDYQLRGYGLSNVLVSMKYALYQNLDQRFEITGAAGVNIPFSRSLLKVDGVTLPVDLQPSTASYGLAFQVYLIKENSFRALRYFWINRYEVNFVNPQGYLFGNIFNSSAFVSRHFVFGEGKLKDWTFILQLRYQHKGQNQRDGSPVQASGGEMVMIAPQVNCSIFESWNISLLYEKPLYQYYLGTQLGMDYAFLINIVHDFNLKKEIVLR